MIDVLVQMIRMANNVKDPSIDLHYTSLVEAAKVNRLEPFRTYPSYDLVRGVITKAIDTLETYVLQVGWKREYLFVLFSLSVCLNILLLQYVNRAIETENFGALSSKVFNILSEMIVNYPLALVNVNVLFGEHMKYGKESKRLGKFSLTYCPYRLFELLLWIEIGNLC